jgi:hypothetical protein
MHFLITRSLVFDGDFHWDNDLARFGDPWSQPRTVTGRKNLMQQIGPSLILAPVLVAADGAAKVANVFGAGIERHGYTLFHQRIVFATSVAFAIVAVWLGVWFARRLLGGRWGPAYAGVAALLGTSLTYYATYMPSYAHAMDACASAGFLALWYRGLGELRWKRFVWLGVLLGTAAMVRIGNFAIGSVVALELGIAAARRVRAAGTLAYRARDAALILARGAVVVGVAIALHAPQFYVWKQMYNEWVTTPQGPGWMRWRDPMWLELLFAAKNGWFSTHPLAYLGMFGLAIGVAAGPRLGPHVRLVCAGLLLASATQVYVNAVSYDYWGGASFGQRRMCSSTLQVVVGIAVALRALHLAVRRVPVWGKHAIAVVVLGWFVTWNVVWVNQLRHGKAAGREPGPICCADVPRPLRWIADPVYRAVGNPFSFPASAVFAIRHGVGIHRWDRAVGNYPFQPPHLGYNDGSYRRQTGTWFPSEPYLIGGWGPVQVGGGKKWRWTTAEAATFMVPMFLPEPHRVTVPIAANVAAGETVEVEVRWNGALAGRARVGATWTTITLDTDGEVGEAELSFTAPVAPYRGAPAPNTPAGPTKPVAVGVAVGLLTLGLPPRPAPSGEPSP